MKHKDGLDIAALLLLLLVAIAVMVVGVMLWCACYSAVMTSDKFLCLFGRVIPKLALVLSMALRFIPMFKRQMHKVNRAQKAMGLYGSKSLVDKGRSALRVFLTMISWSLENAIDTAASMKARGYGLPGRTAFSIYRFDSRDKAALAWLLFCGFFIFCGWMAGGLSYRYYPTMKGAALTPMTISFQLVYLALCLTPVLVDRWADWSWRRLEKEEG